jgi:membrane-bound lytic murein transglycosylase F
MSCPRPILIWRTHRARLKGWVVPGLFVVASVAGCRPAEPPPLPPEPRSGLVIATRNSPTTYYEDRSGDLAGLEYELSVEFAEWMELPLEFVVLDSVSEILEAVESGAVDIAAAGLTRTTVRSASFITGPDYQQIEERVVCNRRSKITRLDDLFGRDLRIISDSSYDETLLSLQEEHPDLLWSTTEEHSTEQLLQLVWEGEIDCTVADSNILALDRRYLPELETPFALGRPEGLAWFLAAGSSDLVEPLEQWFDEISASGRLVSLLERYYSHTEQFDYYDTAMFFKRIDARLPLYEDLFFQAGITAELDWRLLAAVSYQESHWDPEAISGTGVRGLMMLTRDTAADLGVDRLDPLASIEGGSRYLAELIRRMPSYIEEPDRIWLALAAYNVGYSHLEDARKLAVELGRNPSTWAGVKSVLPHLSQPRYYRGLRHGYARGNEPVVYVERIRNYYDLLAETVPLPREPTMPSGVVLSTTLISSADGNR